jgi:hypothetical protein
VDYQVVGTTRFREYFPPEITAQPANITRRGPLFRVNVLSSARPESPRLEYLLPTFTWEERRHGEEGGSGRPSSAPHWQWAARLPGAPLVLRRGMASCWARCCGRRPRCRLRRKERQVSLMGMDPVHFSNQPRAVIELDDFSNVARSQGDLSLADDPYAHKVHGLPLTVGYAVAGFEVEFNAERKLWFADLQFNSQRVTTYYPFVRLALARYQPDSIANAHLSPVILTDFMQLVPDRRLLARWIGDDRLYVQVSGYMPVDRAHNRMDVTLQVHDASIPGELGWKASKWMGRAAPCRCCARRTWGRTCTALITRWRCPSSAARSPCACWCRSMRHTRRTVSAASSSAWCTRIRWRCKGQ